MRLVNTYSRKKNIAPGDVVLLDGIYCLVAYEEVTYVETPELANQSHEREFKYLLVELTTGDVINAYADLGVLADDADIIIPGEDVLVSIATYHDEEDY